MYHRVRPRREVAWPRCVKCKAPVERVTMREFHDHASPFRRKLQYTAHCHGMQQRVVVSEDDLLHEEIIETTDAFDESAPLALMPASRKEAK